MRPLLASLAWLLLALSACGGSSQPDPGTPGVSSRPRIAPRPAATTDATDAPDRFRPWVWEVRPPGGGAQSWLLGTIHVGVTAEEALTESLLERLSEARVVITEMDAADAGDLLVHMQLPAGQSLRNMLRPDSWAQLAGELPMIPPAMLERLRPWAVHALLTVVDMTEAPKGEDVPAALDGVSMDAALQARAEASGRATAFLETVDQQVAAMNAVPAEAWVYLVEKQLAAVGGDDDESSDLLAAYRSGELERVRAQVLDAEDLRRHPAYYEKLLFARNERWLPVLDREMRRGNAFVAVGLAHMFGERGLIELLERRGFRVERVERPAASSR